MRLLAADTWTFVRIVSKILVNPPPRRFLPGTLPVVVAVDTCPPVQQLKSSPTAYKTDEVRKKDETTVVPMGNPFPNVWSQRRYLEGTQGIGHRHFSREGARQEMLAGGHEYEIIEGLLEPASKVKAEGVRGPDASGGPLKRGAKRQKPVLIG